MIHTMIPTLLKKPPTEEYALSPKEHQKSIRRLLLEEQPSAQTSPTHCVSNVFGS